MFRNLSKKFVNQLVNTTRQRLPAAAIVTSSIRADPVTPEPAAPLQFSDYTPEQSEKILQAINRNTLQDLLSYDISKTRANKLQTWRQRNGDLQSLQDILQIEGFGLKIAQKFYRSLLEEPKEKPAPAKAQRARVASFITPSIDVEQQQLIRSCVAVRIGVSSVTWARLELPPSEEHENAPCLLTHWQHHGIAEKKLHLSELVQRCLYIDHLIPEADCYLFETPQTAQVINNPGNADQQNISIQKAQITAVISFALCSRKHGAQQLEVEEHAKPQVFYLRRFLTARLFSNLVGTERVSSEQNMLNLMRTRYNAQQQGDFLADDAENSDTCAGNERLSFRGNVEFPQDLREMFARAERYHREFLGQALLLNLAFVRLVLLQDPQSIAAVTRNPNRENVAIEN